MLSTLSNRVSTLLPDPFQAVLRELDREFPWTEGANGYVARKVAPMSVWQDGSFVFAEVDVPGIALEDLDVTIENGKLTITGQRKSVERPKEFLHEERFFGKFERTVALAEWVDPNSIEAQLHDGVLSLKLSKKPEAERQKITINYAKGTAEKLPEPPAEYSTDTACR